MKAWFIWLVPVGPERLVENKILFEGNKDDTLVEYERLRQTGEDYGGALVVTEGRPTGIVYACS